MRGGHTADISLLGAYGICNPMMLWLLNRHPQLLAETPQEYQRNFAGAPPTCDEPVFHEGDEMPPIGELVSPWKVQNEDGREGYEYYCPKLMHFRYVHGRPAWVCFDHTGYDTDYRGHYVPIQRPTPKMVASVPNFNVWQEIGAAIEGRQRDLCWMDGELVLVDVP